MSLPKREYYFLESVDATQCFNMVLDDNKKSFRFHRIAKKSSELGEIPELPYIAEIGLRNWFLSYIDLVKVKCTKYFKLFNRISMRLEYPINFSFIRVLKQDLQAFLLSKT